MSADESGYRTRAINFDADEDMEMHNMENEEEEIEELSTAANLAPPDCISREEEAMIKTSLAFIVVKRRWKSEQNHGDDGNEKKRKVSPADKEFFSPWMDNEPLRLPEFDSKPAASENTHAADSRKTNIDSMDEAFHMETMFMMALQQQHRHGQVRRGLLMNLLQHLQRMPFMSEEYQNAKKHFLIESTMQHPQSVSQVLFNLLSDDTLSEPSLSNGEDEEALKIWIQHLLFQIWPIDSMFSHKSVTTATARALPKITAGEAVYFIPTLQILGISSNNDNKNRDMTTVPVQTTFGNSQISVLRSYRAESLQFAEFYLNLVQDEEDANWEETAVISSQSLLLKVYVDGML